MYKVFINYKPLWLLSHGDPKPTDADYSGIIHTDGENKLTEIIDNLYTSNNINGAVIHTEDPKSLWKRFCKSYDLLEAAGGLVLNAKKELLMIYRFEKWDLPKGKIEEDEKPVAAALREVCEETGVCDCGITAELQTTYHTYIHKNKDILKKTYWFEMNCKTFSGFRLQDEEGIKEAKWMNKKEAGSILAKSYPSIKDLVKNYFL